MVKIYSGVDGPELDQLRRWRRIFFALAGMALVAWLGGTWLPLGRYRGLAWELSALCLIASGLIALLNVAGLASELEEMQYQVVQRHLPFDDSPVAGLGRLFGLVYLLVGIAFGIGGILVLSGANSAQPSP